MGSNPVYWLLGLCATGVLRPATILRATRRSNCSLAIKAPRFHRPVLGLCEWITLQFFQYNIFGIFKVFYPRGEIFIKLWPAVSEIMQQKDGKQSKKGNQKLGNHASCSRLVVGGLSVSHPSLLQDLRFESVTICSQSSSLAQNPKTSTAK